MEFKIVDPVLWSSIKNQVDNDFGKGVTQEIMGDFVPIILEYGSIKSLYRCSMNWIDILEQGLGSYELYSMGLLFGEIVQGKLKLSIAILDQIASLTTNYIVISDKGVGPFTYGKSILKESVKELGQDLKKGQRVIVFNEDYDCLGLAMLTVDGYRVDRLQPDDLFAKNLADIGLYVRKLY
jgi:ribosome biogenesis protein Nip4